MLAYKRSSWRFRLCAALALCLALLAVPALRAQPRADTLWLGRDDLLKMLRERDPLFARGHALRTQADAERARYGSWFPGYPQLDFERVTDAPFHNNGDGGWSLGLNQEFDISGRFGARMAAAHAAGGELSADADLADADAATRGQALFARLIVANERMRLTGLLAAAAMRLDSLAARLLAAGEISELDRNLVRIQRVQATIEAEQATGRMAAEQADLRLAFGIGRDTVVAPKPGYEDVATALLDSAAAFEAGVARGDADVLARRPEWRALQARAQRLRAERDIAARSWVPNVRLGLALHSESMVLRGEDITGSEVVRSGFTRLASTDMLLGVNVGLAVPLPINGLYPSAGQEVAVAEGELALVDADRAVLVGGIRRELAHATERLRAAARGLRAYQQEIVPIVARNLELAERGYAAGELSASQVVQLQDQLMRTGTMAIELRMELEQAVADVNRVMGR